jgi:hypothetical protein
MWDYFIPTDEPVFLHVKSERSGNASVAFTFRDGQLFADIFASMDAGTSSMGCNADAKNVFLDELKK